MLRILSATALVVFSLSASADDITTTAVTSGKVDPNSPVPLTPTTTNTPQNSTVVPPGSTTVPPHTPTTIITTPPATQPAPVSVPGGYNEIKVTDPEVQKAAAFAVAQINQGTLVKIVSAQAQVVAGKNFNLQLVLLQNGVNYQYAVTVFVPLPSSNQPMQLTNVAAMGQVDDSETTTAE